MESRCCSQIFNLTLNNFNIKKEPLPVLSIKKERFYVILSFYYYHSGGGAGELCAAAFCGGLRISIEAAVKTASLPAFVIASFRVIFLAVVFLFCFIL